MTARRAAKKTLIRLVPVSSAGAPAWRTPGTGLRVAFGLGGGGGSSETILDGLEARPVWFTAASGPEAAPAGTTTKALAVDLRVTRALASSAVPGTPRKITPVTPDSPLPRRRSVDPARGRLRLAHALTQVTCLTAGVSSNCVPPPVWAPAAPGAAAAAAATQASATPVARVLLYHRLCAEDRFLGTGTASLSQAYGVS